MKIFFFIGLIILQCFFFQVQSVTQSLPVIFRKGNLELATSEWIDSENSSSLHLIYSLPLLPWPKIYHFCPLTEERTDALQFIKYNRQSEPSHPCEGELPMPVVIKVTNPEELKKSWNKEIEWYTSGYKIDKTDILNDLKISSDLLKTKYQYQSLNNNEAIIPGLSAFYNKTIKQVIAVEYELLPSFYYAPDPEQITTELYYEGETPDLSNYENFFGLDDVKNTLVIHDKMQEEKKLKLIAMAPPSHFIAHYRKRFSWVKINSTSLWSELTEHYKRITLFLEAVAKKTGKLKIVSGVTGIGSTQEEREKRTYSPLGKTHKIIVHDFLWKVVEFKFKKQVYGIVIVLRNSLYKTEKKLCEEDVCEKHRWFVREDANENIVYCCNMDKQTISNLEVDFLELQERVKFDLTPWKIDDIDGTDESEDDEESS